jgi:hypothetical protein
MRPQSGEAHDNEINRDDVVQKARYDENQNAGDERDERLYQQYIEGHEAGLRIGGLYQAGFNLIIQAVPLCLSRRQKGPSPLGAAHSAITIGESVNADFVIALRR